MAGERGGGGKKTCLLMGDVVTLMAREGRTHLIRNLADKPCLNNSKTSLVIVDVIFVHDQVDSTGYHVGIMS